MIKIVKAKYESRMKELHHFHEPFHAQTILWEILRILLKSTFNSISVSNRTASTIKKI